MIGNISNIWVKPRVQTRNTLTHWRTTHEAQGCSKTKMVFLLSLHWCHINSSWPVAGNYAHTTQIHVHYISKSTQSYYDYILGLCQPGAATAQPAKLSGLHLFSSLNLPLSYSVLFSLASPSLSFFLKLPSKARETTFSCDTNFPN